MLELITIIFFELIIIFSIIIIRYSINIYNSNYNKLLFFLSKNIENIVKYKSDNYINMLRMSSLLFHNCQKIIQVSKSEFMTYFKYDYSKGYITLNFLFTINKKGLYVDNLSTFDLPLSSNIITSKLLKCDNNFNSLYIDDIKDYNDAKDIYIELKKRNINKIYYKNLYTDIYTKLKESSSNRVGLFMISYTDDHIMTEDEQSSIMNIIHNMNIPI